MKVRMTIALAVLLAGALLLTACGSQATPVPTSTSAPTAAPTTAVVSEPTAVPAGGIDVAWEHVVQPEVNVLARVNGVEITKDAYLDELGQQLQQVTIQYSLDWNDESNQVLIAGFQDSILEQMVQEELTYQLAAAEGISVAEAEVQAEVSSAMTSVLESGMYANWDDFMTKMGYTTENLNQQITTYLLYQKLVVAHGGPTEAEQVHAAHILVTEEQTGTLILEKLAAGESFADLAAQYSTDTGSAGQGGDLGWFPRGAMVTQFEDAAFALEVGQTSGLVASDYGYHIITVLGKEVRALEADMLQQSQQENYQAWFAAELAKANVETLVQFEQPAAAPTP